MASFEIISDESGTPLVGFGTGSNAVVAFTTTQLPASKRPAKKPTTTAPDRFENLTHLKWHPWGTSDRFPNDVMDVVRKSTIAKPALQLLTKIIYGKRLVPCIIEDYDENGKEVISYLKHDKYPQVYSFLQRSQIDNWRLKVIQDYTHFANAFPELILSKDRSEISMLAHNKAAHTRLGEFDVKAGRIKSAFISASFPHHPLENEITEIQLIDPDQLYFEVERVKEDTAFKYVFPTQWPDVVNSYYSLAYWDGSRSNGWMEISNSIPQYKKALFKNSMNLKYHIKIPFSYWEKKYPNWRQLTQAQRDVKANELLGQMNDYLTGAENAYKTFISHFTGSEKGYKVEDEWKIEVLDDKMKNDAYLPDASAANAEILFSFLVNPAMTGASMSAGNYTGGSNSGGSNIRESHLIMQATLEADRQVVYQVMEFVKMYNGWDPRIEFRTIDQVLTTLDKGRGTEKTVS